jgi:hypothetical protein
MSLAASTNPTVLPLGGSDIAFGDAAAYYTAIAPTPGTGILGPVSTTLDEAKALMTVYNGGVLNIYPRWLRLHVSVVGTTGTIVQFTQAVDSGNRFSSGGSALVPKNTNMASTATSAAAIQFGALVTTAPTSARRLLHHTKYRSAIEVVDDQYQFSWGSSDQLQDPTSLVNNSTTIANVTFAYAPVVIGPGQTFVLHQWRGAITVGITFDVEFGYVEK